MIEKVFDAGVEIGFAKSPAAKRYGDAIFLLDISFAKEREEGATVATGVVEQIAGDGVERRGLVEIGIGGAEDPIEFRDGDCGANAGIGGVLGDLSREMRVAKATAESEPG